MKKSIFVVMALVFARVALADSQRILFVAPHPDDEMLGTGAQIFSAQKNLGGSVDDYRVVIMTCGDGYTAALDDWKQSGQAQDLNGDGKIDYLDLGIARHLESLSALAMLGVPSEKVIFLGYPDGGLAKLAHSGGPAYESPLTQASNVPYLFAFHFQAPYTGDSVVSDLKDIITSFNPTLVYSTTPTDEHPDHAETREYVTMALAQAGGDRTHLEYLIHWEQAEKGWPHPTMEWASPLGHIPADISVKLADLGMDVGQKHDAIGKYSTQVAVDGQYLFNFAKNSEVFWKTRASITDYLDHP